MAKGRVRGTSSRKIARVFVDAKILNMHDRSLEKEAYVGYVVEGGRARAKRITPAESGRMIESDDAEILAVLFAIDDLKDEFRRVTIVCDHESVVSEANRNEVKGPSPLMARLRDVLRSGGGSVQLEVLQANPAHRVVTEYVNSLKGVSGPADGEC